MRQLKQKLRQTNDVAHQGEPPEVLMTLRILGWSLLVPSLLALGCNETPPDPARAELGAYCRVASRVGLNSWVGNMVTTCVNDGTDEATCSLFRVRGSALDAVSLPSSVTNPVWAAETSNGLFVLAESGQLSRIQDSNVEVIAPLAADPSLSSAGDRLVFLSAPAGATEWELGGTMLIQSYSVRTRRLTTVTEDGLGSSPHAIPGSDDVLFVSTRTDVAAIFRVTPGGQAMQLTNEGMTGVEQGFVPPLTEQAVWTPDGLFYAFSSDTGSSMVLHLDVRDGSVEEVGPGFWPRLDEQDDILALAPAGSDPCAFTYAAAGAP